jgi:hypothetical protein
MRRRSRLLGGVLLAGMAAATHPDHRISAAGGPQAALLRPDRTVSLLTDGAGPDALVSLPGVDDAESVALLGGRIVVVRESRLWATETAGDKTLAQVSNDPVRAVNCGPRHCLAISQSDHVLEWSGHSAPTVVSGLQDVAAVAAGERHDLALTHTGRIYAWGANDRGQLGASGPDRRRPSAIGNLGPALSVAAGSEVSLAALADGTVRAWGANDLGQLGVGDFADRDEPTVVPGLSRIVRVATSGLRSGALGDDGELWLFGDGQDRAARAETPGELVDVRLSGDVTVGRRSDGEIWTSSPRGTEMLSDRRADAVAAGDDAARGQAPSGGAALVVGEGPLSPMDRAVRRRLRELGLRVTLLGPRQATTGAVAHASIVLISSSVEAREVDAGLAAAHVPIVTWEPFVFRPLGMASADRLPSHGTISGRNVSIVREEHPLAGGRHGLVTVSEERAPIAWAAPAPSAEIAAVGPTGMPAVFGYRRGTLLPTGMAPASRVGLFLPAEGSPRLTAENWSLFDASVHWALANEPPEPSPQPLSGGGFHTTNLTGGNGTILLVVGSLSPLSAGDTAVKNRMVGMGFTVQTIAASDPNAAAFATGKALVYVSQSAPNGTVLGTFAFVNVPVLIQDAGIVNDMYMTEFGDRGTCGPATDAVVSSSTHPIVYGLTGTQTLSTSTGPLFWGFPSAAGRSAFGCVGTPSQSLVFTYEHNATMAQGITAPNRRVMYGFPQAMPATFTTTGWDVFDRTIFWATYTNVQPYVNAGPDQTVALGTTVSLNGVVVDDGLPNATPTITWSKISGPGTVTFGSPSQAVSTATFSAIGTYVVRLTAADGAATVLDEATIYIYQPGTLNQAPQVNAGPDQAVTLPSAVTLNGTVTDDGLPSPPGATTKTWTKVSGPGTVTFGSPSSASTTATFSLPGVYTLRLTASDSLLSGSDDVVVTAVPSVLLVVGSTTLSAGDARTKTHFEGLGFTVVVKLASSASSADATGRAAVWLSSTCPNLDLVGKFTAVGVPVAVQHSGTVDNMNMTLGDSNSRGSYDAQSQVTILAPTHPLSGGLTGTVTTSAPQGYFFGVPGASAVKAAAIVSNTGRAVVFGYEAGAPMFNNATAPERRLFFGFGDLAMAKMSPAGDRLLDAAAAWLTRSNGPPWVDAGPDRTVVLSGATVTVNLAGQVFDDGLPNPPATTTASWSAASAAGNVTFGNAAQAATTATLDHVGGYMLRLTASDGQRTASDVVLVTVRSSTNAPPVVSAGVDQSIRLPQTALLSAVASDDGLPSGTLTTTWSNVSGPGTATFGAPSALATTATFPSPGVYVLRVTVSDGSLASYDDVQVRVDPTANLLMVSGQSPAVGEDLTAKTHLESLGFTVTVKTDTTVAAGDATNKALAVVTATANATAAAAALSTSATPIVIWQPSLFDDFGMANSGASGTGTATGTDVLMAGTAHRIAANLTGTQTVYGASGNIGWGVPATNAIKVATLTTDNTKATVFAYEAGSVMASGAAAAARRVGLFVRPDSLNATGWLLFDAAVGWATERPVRALLVVSTTPGATDALYRERLASLGFSVTVLGDSVVTASDAVGKAVVLIAPMADGATLGTKLTNVPVPVLLSVNNALSPMGFTGPTAGVDFGTVTGTQVTMLKPGQPASAGLSGTVTVETATSTLGWAKPVVGSSTRVAVAVGAPAGARSIFFYEPGDAMVGLTAPERRVGFFVTGTGTQNLTAEGWRLFDAAVLFTADSDGDHDGLGFADEYRYGTSPTNPDTNGDGILDGPEVHSGRDAVGTDVDGDGVSNAVELQQGTDPFRVDTDGDGVSDATDCFALDPTRWLCPPQQPGDTTPPVITLQEPINATLLPPLP